MAANPAESRGDQYRSSRLASFQQHFRSHQPTASVRARLRSLHPTDPRLCYRRQHRLPRTAMQFLDLVGVTPRTYTNAANVLDSTGEPFLAQDCTRTYTEERQLEMFERCVANTKARLAAAGQADRF